METWVIITIIVLIIIFIVGGILIYWFLIRPNKTKNSSGTGRAATGGSPAGGSSAGGASNGNRASSDVKYGDKIRLVNDGGSSGFLYQCGNVNNDVCSRNVSKITNSGVAGIGVIATHWILKSATKADGEIVMTEDEIQIVSVSDNKLLKVCSVVTSIDDIVNVGTSSEDTDTSDLAIWSIVTKITVTGQRPPTPVAVKTNTDFLILNKSIAFSLVLQPGGSNGSCGNNVVLSDTSKPDPNILKWKFLTVN
uniref:Uncharacterized protein n=1 Tax=Pithovirus LCPAC101 TaxID=2506586 RepID=A0A481Z1X2_9VIRU|nr:MAG: hypothetical protein LCPAC101_00100 [Pithovirus LCPAC101]